MKQEEKYCSNCKFFIGRMHSVYVTSCTYVKEWKVQKTPIERKIIPIHSKCEELNKENKCLYHKRKWWKFWR